MRISDILNHTADTSPLSPCVIYHQEQEQQGGNNKGPSEALCLTYQAARQSLQDHGHFLRQRRQIKCPCKEVVVAFLASNSADLFLAVLACSELGKAVMPVLLNTRWTPSEMAQALQSQNLNDETWIVHDEIFTETAKQAADVLRQNHSQVSTMPLPRISQRYLTPCCSRHEKIWQNQIPTTQQYTQETQLLLQVEHDDDKETAVVLFTSGTTSGSKGVLLSHKALYIQALAKLQTPCQYSSNTNMLATTVPLFHVGGLSSALAVCLAGGAMVFPTVDAAKATTKTAGFQPKLVLQSVRQGRQFSSNTLVVVPAMLSSLMEQLHSTSESFPYVDLILIGGQSATPSLLQQLFRRFPNARIVQTYACTEGASSLTFLEMKRNTMVMANNRSDDNQQQFRPDGDCVGYPPSHVELCLVPVSEDDKDDPISAQQSEQIQEAFTPGVLATRGPHILTGYWRRGGRSIRSYVSPLTQDGWFITNDLLYRDDQGCYYFSGRVHDVIRTGGETVVATEVERVLLEHKDISECAVFSLSDTKFGEAICAAIVLKPGLRPVELQGLRKWCATRGLAGYKRPRRLFLVQELPRNSSGKLLKRLLVERFRQYPAKSGNGVSASTPLIRSKL